MPRDDDYDDYGVRPARAPFPGGVKAAGIIWIAFGVLGLLGQLFSFVMNVANQAAQAGPGQPGGNVCGIGCGVLFALAFLIIGIQTVRGTAKGTLGNGIGSLIFGLLYAGLAVFAFVMGVTGRLPAPADTVMLVLGGLMALLALALFTAGILAIAGRDAYAQWRAAEGLDRPARRRTQEERDYDDDRPRRRRGLDDEDDRPRRRPRDEDEDDDRPRRRPRDEDDDR